MGNKNYKYFFALNKRKSIKKISDKEINKFGKGGGEGIEQLGKKLIYIITIT